MCSDDAGRGLDRDRERVGDRVVDRDELELERAERLDVTLARRRTWALLEPVLLELGLDQGQRQLRTDDRDVVALAQQVGHAADVVLVAVRQHDADDVLEAVPDGAEVGQDQVDAGLVLLGEQHAAVDDEELAAVLEDRHVAADLAEPAERDDAQCAFGSAGGGSSSRCMWLIVVAFREGPSRESRRERSRLPRPWLSKEW